MFRRNFAFRLRWILITFAHHFERKKVIFQDLGLLDYKQAWDYQLQIHKGLVAQKLANRSRKEAGLPLEPATHHLLYCEHPPVYTLGRNGSIQHLLVKEEDLAKRGFQFYKINRGGDITFHGPGQLVVYPIFDLDDIFKDVGKYIRSLEEVVIRTLDNYGLKAMRLEDFTGVWLPAKGGKPKRKICAIGVHLSRWVSMHGFALNVNADLSGFSNIIPCGIDDLDKDVSSLDIELGGSIDMNEVKGIVKKQFEAIFGLQIEMQNSSNLATDEKRHSKS